MDTSLEHPILGRLTFDRDLDIKIQGRGNS
jgi:hypothetical protein